MTPSGPLEPRYSSVELVETPIPGLVVVHLPVHADSRGWFKENWQREKMVALGLPAFEPVQNNVSYNARRGATRGIHTEPWDKFVSVATGRVFSAWVDMREGPTFGTEFHLEMDPSIAVFVPRGVGNGYQTLEDGTAYTYLVNDHWRPGVSYPALALDDPTSAIPWPIPLSDAAISEKDSANPRLGDVLPMPPKRTLVLGAGGQLGDALATAFPDAVAVTHSELDLTDPVSLASWPWHVYDVVLNAAAYTAVDAAETEEGRRVAWATNAAGPAELARLSNEHGFTLVHVSSDYVFDGTEPEHTEEEPLSPLGVYGQSKAAGDLAVACARRHYLLRASWVVGEGANFVRTMQRLAANGVSPTVVADQFGRLTFTEDLVAAIRHLVGARAPYGTYNVTNTGPAMSWAEIARVVFELGGRSADDVTAVSSEEYAAGRAQAPRPTHSSLDLTKLRSTGFEPREALVALEAYCGASRP